MRTPTHPALIRVDLYTDLRQLPCLWRGLWRSRLVWKKVQCLSAFSVPGPRVENNVVTYTRQKPLHVAGHCRGQAQRTRCRTRSLSLGKWYYSEARPLLLPQKVMLRWRSLTEVSQ
jgi:hypothetical protein